MCVKFANVIILIFSSARVSNSTPAASQSGKDGDKKKETPQLPKPLVVKGRETVKTAKGKGKISLPETPQCHLKKCPSLYTPHGTDPHVYYPIIVRFFEDFKLQLKMAQSKCVTFVSWPHPVTSSKKDWQADKDTTPSTNTTLPLVLSVPHSPTVIQQQKETKDKREVMEVDSLWNWDCNAFDSDQRLFYDSDQNGENADPKSSQTRTGFDYQTPPHSVTTVPPENPMDKPSPLKNDFSIHISSSNSNASSIIHHGRRKRRKLLSRKIMGSSDVTTTADKGSISNRQTLTSSLPRTPVYCHSSSSSSSQVNVSQNNEEPTDKKRYKRISVYIKAYNIV